ncbi:putative phage tail assembly chaperone [Photorhabdus tasmaniensis]|uniref:Phage protein n=1 Tax=Photorhabdus tasmaniensis TaxID=1004159 RepID=A0ABX0GFZ2_9GAMM|nr:putative phage tail assembly chaperone [Photorhabdus tasmaniensis]NHB87191.1 hypothetical protein [Photorhabdus tasmaniensis]
MKTISLTVSGTDVQFAPTLVAYNKCLNESASGQDVIGAINTYLKRIVVPDHREALNGLLQLPGVAAQIAQKVNELYAPVVEIEVKE